ncbi:Aspartyl/Asparaginyl beta-hydroxylase family protein [Xanthomonas citri pv. mangiferaeindicae LMG 941]|uniref:aspartyl/asparaginyl beta-hydroxylase domain-containing protein n=1 Tax=Xanthomonas citri TaxID=346 RepID=UPI0002552ADA|nr:aspartyl/asparaginyl beta-hydroxylase domain-containing protein [Xanthomonas citri]CCG36469.1 Aspartyl/Asparaginyl beta-hydroxylase family protein [Xanthomonas citri pv. mangiferaeindicae LMG 941]
MNTTAEAIDARSDEATARRLREAYLGLIALYKGAGRAADAASCAELAVRQGLWNLPQQRPIELLPGLTASPVHAAADFPVCAYLESHAPAIQAEIHSLAESARYTTVEEPLANQGWWGEAIFRENGIRYEATAERFPRIADIVDGLPEDVLSRGVVMLSLMSPGTHIMPHCGYTNARLRVHMGILTPPDAVLRVHDQYLEWQEGRCLVFDDSFEHEVWHYGETPRLVLLLDIPHPELVQHGGARADDLAELRTRTAQFMAERGIRSVELDAEGVRVEPDGYHTRLMRRHMDELGAGALRLDDDGMLLVSARATAGARHG